MTLKEAIELFNNYKLDEAKLAFEELLTCDAKNVNHYIYLGKINARTQNYGEAMNYFSKALELDSNNKQAKIGIKLTQNILQLANNFYFENAYTDDDLYDF